MSSPASAPRKRVRLDYDERRGQILSAARQLFCARPYSEVSMADLAGAANVTRGLLHHYFGSKRDLYLAVVRDLVQVQPMPPRGDRPDSTWEASVEGWMRLIEANEELWLRSIGSGGPGRDPELEQIVDESKELTAMSVIRALGVDPATAPEELVALVRGYGGMAQEITREWLERGRLTRAQAKALLLQAMPTLVEHVLPAVVAARPSPGGAARSQGRPRRRPAARTR